MVVYTASWLLPVATPPLQDAALAVEGGKIVRVGPRRGVLDACAGAEVRELGQAIVLPGLVNAHTHVELSWLAGRIPAGLDYVEWVRCLVAEREHEDPTAAREAACRAIEQLVARGTVAVADVANQPWAGGLLAASPLHALAFLELYGLRAELAATELERAAAALDTLGSELAAAGHDRVRAMLAPHAPHTTGPALLRALAGRSTAAGAPLSIHLAESVAETRWLADASGPFRALFAERSFVPDDWTPPHQSPVAYLNRLGVLSTRTLAVHCVHLEHQDIALLQARGATVVTCPRSNERLHAGKAPVPQILGAGIPVALGTDSLASAPDLDLFAEMAALRRVHPSLSPAGVLRMATLNGARALGLHTQLGSVEAGKLADGVIVVPAPAAAEPLEVLLSVPPQVFRLDRAPSEVAG